MTVQWICCQRNAVNCVAGMQGAVHMQIGLVLWLNTSLSAFLYHLLQLFMIFPSPKFYYTSWARTKGGLNMYCPIKPMLGRKFDSSIQFLQLGTAEICGSISVCCQGWFCICMTLSSVPSFHPPGASRVSSSDNQSCLLTLPSPPLQENITPS